MGGYLTSICKGENSLKTLIKKIENKKIEERAVN